MNIDQSPDAIRPEEEQFPIRKRALLLRPGCLIGYGILGILGLLIAWEFWLGLPSETEIKNFNPPSTTQNTSDLWRDRVERSTRISVPLGKISPWLRKAVIVSEDDMFYQHNGVNFEMLKQAFRVNWERKKYARGASTITMQLARNAFLHKRKTLLRKIREIILAKKIEKILSKDRIFELYLNLVEWGSNIYGAEAGAQFYFGKSANDLTLSEATLMAALLPNPKFFNPFKRPDRCRAMQDRVLFLMENAKMISAEQSGLAKTGPTTLRGQHPLFPENDAVESPGEVPLPDSIRAVPTNPPHDALTIPTKIDSLDSIDSL